MNGLNKFRGRPFNNYITSLNIRLFSESKPEQPKKDKAVIMKEYEELFNYMKENSVYKCGNLVDMPSRFGFFKRWRLEK